MGARRGMFGLGVAVLGYVGMAVSAHAAWDMQTITLNPGWNAIHLYVQPEENFCDVVFADVPVDSVWYWNEEFTPVQFLSDPGELLPEEPGWLTYFSDRSRQGFLTDLFAVHAGKSYLIDLAGSQTVTFQIHGKTALRKHVWVADSFNLVGADVHPETPPTVKAYFDGDAATAGQPVYRLGANGKWVEIIDPGQKPLRRGEAYWVYCEGPSAFAGLLAVEAETRGGLDFAELLREQRLTLKNITSEPRKISVRMLPSVPPAGGTKSGGEGVSGEVPLSVLRLLIWEPFDAPMSFTMAPDSEQDILLAVRRGDMAATQSASPQYASILEVSDDAGSLYHVPVLAQKAISSTGLWVGDVALYKVTETGNTANPNTPYLAASTFKFRVMIHVDENNEAKLLSQVILMQADAIAKSDDIDFTQFLDTDAVRYVLVTDSSLIPQFSGIRLVDDRIVGRRLSTPVFGFTTPQPMDGKITTTLTATVVMDYDDPLNPFVHRYHPDHNNMDERFKTLLPEGYESFTFTRTLTLEFTSANPSGPNPPGWGHDIVGGTYREKITGVHRRIIRVEGTFQLQKVSSVGVLNDGL